MRLKLFFGSSTTPIQLDWSKNIDDFPKTLFHDGKGWEWFMFKPYGLVIQVGYELYFSVLKPYDPRFNWLHTPLKDIIGGAAYTDAVCDCGGDQNKDSGGHWAFCKTRK